MAFASVPEANITAQPIPKSSTNFPVKIPFVFIIAPEKASAVPTRETLMQLAVRPGRPL